MKKLSLAYLECNVRDDAARYKRLCSQRRGRTLERYWRQFAKGRQNVQARLEYLARSQQLLKLTTHREKPEEMDTSSPTR